jgi:hypothetical protein
VDRGEETGGRGGAEDEGDERGVQAGHELLPKVMGAFTN